MNGRRGIPGVIRLPDSLFGQIMLVLALGVVILQAANFLAVCGVQTRYIGQVEKIRAEHLAASWFFFNAMTPAQRGEAVASMERRGRPEKLGEVVTLLPSRPDWRDDSPDVARLRRMVEVGFGDGAEPPAVTARACEDAGGIFPKHLRVLETAIALDDGTWLMVTQPLYVDVRGVVYAQRLFVLLEAVVMLLLVGFMLRRVTLPISRLGHAVESFGTSPETSTPLPETGVREVRAAAASFNRMRERICGSLAERDRMLAAMAHDLRTPLTRLQLRLDRVEPEPLRRRLLETAAGMNGILSQGLELARSLRSDERPARLDLVSFVQSIVDDAADVGQNVRLATDSESGPVIVEARPLCLRRCLDNLVANACRYGGGAEVRLKASAGGAVISVADNGPGIPEEALEKVFEPWFRLESSRNPASGGIGLGLAIARNMALLNGGTLVLANRPGGGLVATLTLGGR